MICGALTWLIDHNKNERDYLECLLKNLEDASSEKSNLKECDPFDWINQQAEEVASRQEKLETKMKLDLLDKYESKLSKMKHASKQRVGVRHLEIKSFELCV